MEKLFLFFVLFVVGCSGWQSNMRVISSNPNPPMEIWKSMPKNEFLLMEVSDWVNYHTTKVTLADKERGIIDKEKWGACKDTSDMKVTLLKELGIQAKEINCIARSKYTWNHSGVKVSLNGEEYFMDNGVIMDVPWGYEAVKKSTYDFILP